MSLLSKPRMEPHQYQILMMEVSGIIDELRTNSQILEERHKKEILDILKLESRRLDSDEGVGISEIQSQYSLLLQIQKQLVSGDGRIISEAEPREISAMLSSMGSVLNLFMRHKKELDALAEESLLKEAVLSAIAVLDSPAKARFFATLHGVGMPNG